jgi:hypothetical protein
MKTDQSDTRKKVFKIYKSAKHQTSRKRLESMIRNSTRDIKIGKEE